MQRSLAGYRDSRDDQIVEDMPGDSENLGQAEENEDQELNRGVGNLEI